jgi:ORF6N domain
VAKSAQTSSASVEHITRSILVLRGQRVLLDVELAELYGVATKALLQAVRRNRERFPEDFMIQLTDAEWIILRSQTVTSNAQHGGRRYPPYAFTEQGVAMLSSVLRSHRAIAVNVQIMRAFVRMRELLASNTALARKLDELERKYQHHDEAIKAILSAMRELMTPVAPKHRPIGFTANLGADK